MAARLALDEVVGVRVPGAQSMVRRRATLIALAAALGLGAIGPGASAATAAPAHVVIPKAGVKPGDKCGKGVSGCHGGKFTGEFFGG